MKDPRAGQSLIEMIVALTMLTTAFLGITTLLTRSFSLNRTATTETVASYLAAEGIELTKNMIDYDVYHGNAWETCCSAGDHSVDIANLISLGSTPDEYLKFDSNPNDSTANMYQYKTGSDSPYKRRIRITIPQNYEIDVQSVVTWSSGLGTNESVTAEDHFYDWHP